MAEREDVRDRPRGSGDPIAIRDITLPPARESAGAARRVLRATLLEAGRDEWLDAAELALSEVATNAVLHAHTDIEVHIEVFPDLLCVEVRDFDPTPPVARNYGTEATTGRGMELVERICRSCGVHHLGGAGKVVWFCIGEPGADADPEELLAGWDVEDWADLERDSTEMIAVRLAGMPPNLWLAAREHHDAILRDVSHLLADQDGEGGFDLAAVDRARSAISATLIGALESRGSDDPVPDQIDLVIQVTSDSAAFFAAMQDVLDHAEGLALAGELLVRPGLPEIIAVRDWACEQVIAQLSGVAPSRWPGSSQERFETEVRSGDTVAQWDAASVDGAGRAAVAADDANRIVAVSQAFLDLVGWTRSELLGRRVVTLIPPGLREAHVAGFTRHLTTGETHVLDTPTNLPVLHRDGRQLMCRLLIQPAESHGSRKVFVAWVEPLSSG